MRPRLEGTSEHEEIEEDDWSVAEQDSEPDDIPKFPSQIELIERMDKNNRMVDALLRENRVIMKCLKVSKNSI